MLIPFRIAIVLFTLILSFSSCTSDDTIYIITSDNPSKTETITAEDLKSDLEKVSNSKVEIVDEAQSCANCYRFLIGTAKSNATIQNILQEANTELTTESPGARGGIWHKADSQTIILAGSDIQGMQYAVYDYSKFVLELDPLQYWTGHSINSLEIKDIFSIENRTIAPPKVPLLVYFENDVDELLNLKEPLLEYDWESYKEMIDALVRMRYNGIQMFDLLGRPEFFLRPEYQALVPNYDIDIDQIEKMIDYAHDKGMAVQVDLALGYKIKSLESEYADCWKLHKDRWIDAWKYYLEETPIGKADIFSLRPRNQVWDWEYKSTCGEDKIEVFNEVYVVIDSVIEQHNPEATKVLVCYSDGMDMYNEGFRPPSDWIVAWSDDGYAGFEFWPETTENYNFGTYMHAGFWKNHTVGHPYSKKIDTIMHKMFDQYNATSYCLVNGQQFRPFLFNLEAFSEVCRDPETYTGSHFMQTWADRYFPDSLHEKIFELINGWDEASFGKAGYVQNLWEIKEVIAYLAELSIQSPGKDAKPYTAERVMNDLEAAKVRREMFENLTKQSASILPSIDPNSAFYFDQIHFPINYYFDLLTFEVLLHEMFYLKREYETSASADLLVKAKEILKEAEEKLAKINLSSAAPAKDSKWNGWYDIKKRRPNNGFPTPQMLTDISQAIDTKW
jgi:hypothetical protein